MSETSAWSLGCYLVRDSPKFALVANGIPEAMQSENPMDKILAQHACTHHPALSRRKYRYRVSAVSRAGREGLIDLSVISISSVLCVISVLLD